MERSFTSDTRAGFLVAAAGIGLLTAILAPFYDAVGLLNQGLLLLLLTLVVSATWGVGPGSFAALLSNLSLNFFFTEPLHQLHVADARNVFGLGIFLLVSLVGSSLLASAREAAAQARKRQAQTEVLLELSRALIGQKEPRSALEALCVQAAGAFLAGGAAVLTPAGAGWEVQASAGDAAARAAGPEERAMAERVALQRTIEGTGRTGRGPSRAARVVRHRGGGRQTSVIMAPLLIGDAVVGVLRVDGPLASVPFRDDPDELLRAFAGEAALAVQRMQLAEVAAQSEALQEASEAKTNLMISISHDLKTPLAAIKTSVSSLLDGSVSWSEEDVRAFLETIDAQADHLNRSISDILDLNRVEAGAVRPLLKDAQALDLLQDAVERCGETLVGRRVAIKAERGLVVHCDPSLTVQALVNLVENASKYSRRDGEIRLAAVAREGFAELRVEDDGPGIAASDLPRIFDRFYRARRNGEVQGSGLGLALVRAFTDLSGGTASVESSATGSTFKLVFPAVVPVEVGA